MREREKIMLIGIGELGGIVLEFLCRIPGICDIIAADSNEDWGFRKTNSAILGASYLGLYPNIEFCPVNLLDTEKTAEALSKFNPTIIYNGTTLQSWWVVNELPPDVNARIYRYRCGLGPWISMHLALTAKLMKAVKMSGIDTYVVNTSFPDVTNASLGRVGLAPTIGIGNSDLIIPYIQKTASEKLAIPIANIDVEMIGHHYHGYNWCRNGGGYEAPHYLRIYVKGQDVTDQLGDMKQFVAELPKHAMRPAGRHGQYLVAGSSVKNIMSILHDSNLITHSPGPQGLEGGYPVRLSRKGAEVVLPADMTLEAARQLMLEAQQYDGIQEIKNNGDIILTDEAYETFKEMFDVDCRAVTIDDSFEQARELRKKFEEFAVSQGVVIPK
ncbi:MAG: hypothetical protein JRE14_01485 [Deltaproteobacteria bacterium]|nr:hypothetical protein [Deltaproteobacteria bacterium]